MKTPTEPEDPSHKPSGLRIPLCQLRSLMGKDDKAGIFQTHMIASPIFILKYTFDNVLKSLHQKYSASLKGSCLRHSWVQPICNIMGILLKAGTLEPLSPPGCHRAMGDKHGSL